MASEGRRLTKLTEADRRIIQRALNDAMDDRASFADAYGHTGPEGKSALDQIAQYEALHVKMFAEPSARAAQNARFAAMPSVTVEELSRQHKDPTP